MPFESSVYFAVARTAGADKVLSALQINDAEVVFNGGTPTGAVWTIDPDGLGAIRSPTDAPVPGAGDPKDLFSVQYVSGEGMDPQLGTVSLDMEAVIALQSGTVAEQTLYGHLHDAFVNGGKVKLPIKFGAIAAGELTIELRSLKTLDFRVDPSGPTAIPAHHTGVAGGTDNNPAGSGTYAYTFPAALGGAAVVPVAGTGALPLVGTPPHPVFDAPNPLSDLVLTVDTTVTGVTRTSELRIDLHLPTKIIVLVDRSGSMGAITEGTTSKWDAARAAANLFSTIHGEAINDLSTPNATVKNAYQILLGRFTSSGGFDLQYASPHVLTGAGDKPQLDDETPQGGTPIGQSLMTAKPLLGSGAWERRHLILLTDGMDNSNVAGQSLVDVAASASDLPLLSADKANGIVVHTISYALAGDTQVVTLSDLASDRGGAFLGSESDANELDPSLLRQKFIDILGTIIPVERLDGTGGADNNRFDIEDGVERVIFVAPIGTPIAAHFVDDPTVTTTSAGQANGLSWAIADAPPAGLWDMTGGGTSDKMALVDLRLRMQCSIKPAGLGQPIKIQAVIKDGGRPVSGSDVRVAIRRPGESIGQTITSFIQSGGLVKALQRGHVSRALIGKEFGALHTSVNSVAAPTAGITNTAAAVATGIPASGADTKSLQRLLLEAAERARNLPLEKAGTPLTLVEVEPGIYEAELPGSLTQEEGVYSFHYRADGVTSGGKRFARNQTRSTALAPIPNPEVTEVATSIRDVGQTKVWTATVFPRSSTKRAVGPGLGYALGFHYVDRKLREKLPPPVTIDNIDGTYSTSLEVGSNGSVPEVGLYFGSPDRPGASPVMVNTSKVRKVKVILHQVRIVDDKDGCLTGAGELAFDTIVAPNSNPNRAVRKRIPTAGHFKISSGRTVELNEVIYEGLTEAGASLSVMIGGTEFDWLLFLERKEKLARYHRRVNLEKGVRKYTPGDEPNDPESLADWKIWYTVEVT